MSRTARRAVAIVAICATLAAAGGCGRKNEWPNADSARPAPTSTLVLYDTTGRYGALGELYATEAVNLASHTGTWTAQPVSAYKAGQIDANSLTVYIGSTYDEPLPSAFLADVATGHGAVLWLGANIWELKQRYPDMVTRFGFQADTFDPAPAGEVRYRGATLTRDRDRAGKLLQIAVPDQGAISTLAQAVHADGTTTPWAVQSGRLTYVAEVPLTFVNSGDRYLAFSDILLNLLSPTAPERHRALVRIDGVGPQSDPTKLRAMADYLAGHRVPFSVAVIARYDDPSGRATGGKPVHRTLSEAPEVVAALRYMVSHGGSLIMNGYTHAYAGRANPDGVSTEDYEFFLAHRAKDASVVLEGPVAEDSADWALGRLDAASREWRAVDLPAPEIFAVPHGVASDADYRAISSRVQARYERATYFGGILNADRIDPARSVSQYFPYVVRDVYGAPVIPETLGTVEPPSANNRTPRLPSDVLADARRQLAVRDGVASVVYYAYLGLDYLPALVEGIQDLGYAFVTPEQLIRDLPSGLPK
jgi:uncharacterized protein YdaL